MDCRKVKKMMLDYLEGSVEKNDIKEIENHLSECKECKEEIKRFDDTWKMLESWKDIEPDPLYIARFWENEASYKKESIFDRIKSALWSYKPVIAIILFLISIACVFRISIMYKAEENLFDPHYKQWNKMYAVNIDTVVKPIIFYENEMLAFEDNVSLFTIPDYLEKGNTESADYNDFDLKLGNLKIMDGTGDVIQKMINQHMD